VLAPGKANQKEHGSELEVYDGLNAVGGQQRTQQLAAGAIPLLPGGAEGGERSADLGDGAGRCGDDRVDAWSCVGYDLGGDAGDVGLGPGQDDALHDGALRIQCSMQEGQIIVRSASGQP
jgi:hypothetical protein